MQYLLKSVLDIIIKALADVMDKFGSGILDMLTMDIGESGSVFDAVFGNSFGSFLDIMQILAFTILGLNMIWQLVKIMVTPNGGQETPAAVVASTFAAGIGIYCSTTLISIAQKLFNSFYSYLLTGSNLPWSGRSLGADLWATMTTNLTEAFNDTAATGGQVSVGSLAITLIMMIVIAVQFLTYMIEVVERYVLLGVLYYTSPLAFATAGSKSTRNIFSSWVRMVASQLFLMLCNVIFFKLFIVAFYDYNRATTAIASGSSTNAASVAIVWTFICYGILYVGTRVDSYLGTLGLSAAQTGRGLASSVIASAMVAQRAITTGANATRAVANSRLGKSIAHTTREMADTATARAGIGNHVQTEGRNNRVTGDTFNKHGEMKVNRNDIGAGKMDGVAAAEGFIANAKGAPAGFAENMDKATFKANADNGSVSFRTADGKAEVVCAKAGGAFDNARQREGFAGAAGCEFTMSGQETGDQRWKAWVTPMHSGEQSMYSTESTYSAQKMASYNPEMESKMAEFNAGKNCEAREVRPGMWETYKYNQDGTVAEAKRYTADNVYRPDYALNSTTQNIGGMNYQVSDITAAANNVTQVPSNSIPIDAGPAVQAERFKHTFEPAVTSVPTGNIQNIQSDVNGVGTGIYSYENAATGNQQVFVPAANYSMLNGAQENLAGTFKASNGADYFALNVPQGVDVNEFVNGSVIPRGFDTPPSAGEFQGSPVVMAPQREFFVQRNSNNNIFTAAENRGPITPDAPTPRPLLGAGGGMPGNGYGATMPNNGYPNTPNNGYNGYGASQNNPVGPASGGQQMQKNDSRHSKV